MFIVVGTAAASFVAASLAAASLATASSATTSSATSLVVASSLAGPFFIASFVATTPTSFTAITSQQHFSTVASWPFVVVVVQALDSASLDLPSLVEPLVHPLFNWLWWLWQQKLCALLLEPREPGLAWLAPLVQVLPQKVAQLAFPSFCSKSVQNASLAVGKPSAVLVAALSELAVAELRPAS